MQPDRTLRISVLYPTLLNIYADRGNLLFLKRRCEWRGFGFKINSVGVGDPLEPAATDMIYLGGGQDRDQELCAADLLTTKSKAIAECHSDGKPILAVCGGYQLLGRGYEVTDRTIPGIGIAEFDTVRSPGERLVGPVAIRTDLQGPTDGLLVGFENHAGRTLLDRNQTALGKVVSGHGNNGKDRLEGYRDGNLIGTYLHGPLLPKNWWFADWLIAAALGLSTAELKPLEDKLERSAHLEAAKAAGV